MYNHLRLYPVKCGWWSWISMDVGSWFIPTVDCWAQAEKLELVLSPGRMAAATSGASTVVSASVVFEIQICSSNLWHPKSIPNEFCGWHTLCVSKKASFCLETILISILSFGVVGWLYHCFHPMTNHWSCFISTHVRWFVESVQGRADRQAESFWMAGVAWTGRILFAIIHWQNLWSVELKHHWYTRQHPQRIPMAIPQLFWGWNNRVSKNWI